ncbi:MAG: hypothetical protein JO107_12640 [Hyphomicrobiales bacterium]|nr:hypothetical protein [Hyphomicrobiales bacterium]MBV8663939.1 hypothetical protein [Hyphomicrobiales bacterium]
MATLNTPPNTAMSTNVSPALVSPTGGDPNLAHSIIGGPGTFDPGHHVGSPFGLGGDNYANNNAYVTAGNGVGNFIGGYVTADAHQDVGNVYGFGDNYASNSASAIVGNGAYNTVAGSVIADADQQVGNHII